MQNVSHAQAIEILKGTKGLVKFKVKRRCYRVTLQADHGKYGLGLRGGSDVRTPIVVSRIAPDSPAGRATIIEVSSVSFCQKE